MKKGFTCADLIVVVAIVSGIYMLCFLVNVRNESINLRGVTSIYPPVKGVVNKNITQASINDTICNPSWTTKDIRPSSAYTTALKKKQIVQFHYADTKLADYELDHLISLELGGDPKDPDNLWPERYTTTPVDGGARYKDKAENELHREVCTGELTLAAAQHIIVTDWYAFYKKMEKSPKYGSVDNYIDQDDGVDISTRIP